MALDFDTLYAEAHGASLTGGKKRYYDNRVTELKTEDCDGKHVVRAIVRGAATDHNVSITFDEQGGLYDYACDCPQFNHLDGPCKHIVATALRYEDVNPAPPEPARARLTTGPAALNLITEYSRRKHVRRMATGEAKVELVPILILDGDRLSLRFTIGRTRQYLLKDISDFVSGMQSGAFKRYGVELSFTHAIEAFTPASQQLVRFLTKVYYERTMFSENEGKPMRDEIRLMPHDVDAFFDLYVGQTVQFNALSVRDGMRLLVQETDYSLSVDKIDGGYKIETNLPPFKTVTGASYTYLITDTRMIRVGEEFVSTALPALKILNTHRAVPVSEGDMPLFYNSVLSDVERFVPIVSQVDLSVFEAAPLTAVLYLHKGEGSTIAATLKCAYDDVAVDILDETNSPDVVRDWETERALKSLLEKYFPSFPELVLSDEAELYNFLSTGITELYNYAEVYLDEQLKKIRVRKPPRVKVGVRLESDLLNLDVEADGFSRDELIKILNAYRARANYVRLGDGSFVNLDDPSLAAVSEIFEIAGTEEIDSLKIPTYYAPFINAELMNGFFSLERNRAFKEMIGALSAVDAADIEVPPEVRDVMRNYQKTGYRWLKTLQKYKFGGILADDMGLGKSLQIIALILSERAAATKPSIIVCPTTLILNWVSEFKKFAPDLKVCAVMGTAEERKTLVETTDAQVIITSYELIRRDEALYDNMQFSLAVVDEAQYIKNPETRNAKATKSLRADYRFALTGTPIENSLAELWSIFDFIMPGYLYSYRRFRETFEAEIVRGNESAANRLTKLVQPFILRRLKSNVLSELPPKVETDVVSPLEDEQQKLYAANLALVKDSLVAQGAEINKVVVLSMLTKLRQICCDPHLVYPDYAGNTAKLDACLDLLDSAVISGHKVLLFSQFTSMLDILRGKLTERGISHFVLKGDTPKAERMRLVNRFNVDDTKVFLISLKAGGTGLNLTGADVVIHYDPWWNESVMNQATDRAYRIGQNKSVQVYKLILENTIEQKIIKLQEKKTALSSMVVGAAPWEPKDILELLE